jgi:hypothetical protein
MREDEMFLAEIRKAIEAKIGYLEWCEEEENAWLDDDGYNGDDPECSYCEITDCASHCPHWS